MASQALKALAEMTMDLIERQPDQAAQFTAGGFQMLWGALTSKAERLLGWTPRSREDAIVATAESLLKFGIVGSAST